MCLFEFDFGVVCCFAGFGSWSAWSYDLGRFILLWLFCLLICDFFFRARFVFVLYFVLLLLDKIELLCTLFNA